MVRKEKRKVTYFYSSTMLILRDGAVALFVGHRNCGLQVAGSNPGTAYLGQATYTGVLHSLCHQTV